MPRDRNMYPTRSKAWEQSNLRFPKCTSYTASSENMAVYCLLDMQNDGEMAYPLLS